MSFTKVKSLDELPEPFRAHYVQVGEEWFPDLTDFDLHPRALTLRRSAEQLRREKDEAIRALVPFRDAGITVEKWEELQQLADKAKAYEGMDKAGGVEGMIALRTKEMSEVYRREVEKLQKNHEKISKERDAALQKWKDDRLSKTITE